MCIIIDIVDIIPIVIPKYIDIIKCLPNYPNLIPISIHSQPFESPSSSGDPFLIQFVDITEDQTRVQTPYSKFVGTRAQATKMKTQLIKTQKTCWLVSLVDK